MNSMRPFQIGVIAGAVILALLGLYMFTTFQGFGGPKEEIGSVVIWGTLPQAAVDTGLNELVERGGEAYIDVSYVERSPQTFSTDLANAIASGVGPDLIILSQENLLTEKAKLAQFPFTSLSERNFINTYLPFFELFLEDGGFYGVPLVLDPLVLYYNESHLASAGIVSAPGTWEAVSALAPSLSYRDDRGTVTRSAIALGEYVNVTNARSIISLLLLQSGATITEKTEQGLRSTLGNQESAFGATPAQSAVSYYAQFANPSKTVYSWNGALPNAQQAFVAGDLTFYIGFASERPYISRANPNLDFDIAQIPQPGTSANKLTYGTGYAFALPLQSRNPVGAEATAFALSSEGGATIANTLSMSPATKALFGTANTDRYTAIFFPEALTARGWLSPAPYITDAIFSAMISDIQTGRADVSQAVIKADQSLNAVLR